MWTNLRGIVEEQVVSDQADKYNEAFPRFSEAWEGLKWLLCRTPELKGAVRKEMASGAVYWLYTAAGDPLADTPDISIVYRFGLDEVTIYGLKAIKRVDVFD